MKLTEKQKRFADEYILTGNATQSAIKAGYSEKTAAEIGHENLRKPNILAYIESKLEQHEIDIKLRQKQAFDFAIRVLQEEETEEHAFVVGDETGTEVQTIRLKPKIKDKADAAKFITTILSTVEKNRLQNIKLEKEIAKLEKDLQTDTSTEDKLKAYFEALGSAFRES